MDIIVRQAVDVGKLQAGQKISPTRGTVDLDSLLNKCTWLLAGYPKACDVSLRRDAARVSRHVVSDGEWLWEILMNFLTNACKYTAAGHIALTITSVTRFLSTDDLQSRATTTAEANTSGGAAISRTTDQGDRPTRTWLRVECADSGIGVPLAQRDALFQPFGTLQDRTLHGTGIGLFNVQHRAGKG